jgi:hypothetical protein
MRYAMTMEHATPLTIDRYFELAKPRQTAKDTDINAAFWRLEGRVIELPKNQKLFARAAKATKNKVQPTSVDEFLNRYDATIEHYKKLGGQTRKSKLTSALLRKATRKGSAIKMIRMLKAAGYGIVGFWIAKVALVFSIAFAAETLKYLGASMFGPAALGALLFIGTVNLGWKAIKFLFNQLVKEIGKTGKEAGESTLRSQEGFNSRIRKTAKAST